MSVLAQPEAQNDLATFAEPEGEILVVQCVTSKEASASAASSSSSSEGGDVGPLVYSFGVSAKVDATLRGSAVAVLKRQSGVPLHGGAPISHQVRGRVDVGRGITYAHVTHAHTHINTHLVHYGVVWWGATRYK